ncbi:unnamed protein product [Lymnaea stagnalis]|uniref:NADP-dependent oxidoreductase domain-containing protein n=1 Tax=Lymnaea stagnalis TaxID=6523 RepID=A0AAV2I4N7_LYMST
MNMSLSDVTRTVQLISGHLMPIIGLGTYKMHGYEVLYRSVDAALVEGYRSFDTAAVYRNEADLGKVFKELLPKYNLRRKDIFIITKLGPGDHGKGKAMAACLASLERLDCLYLDLYLIHWPGAQTLLQDDHRQKQLRKESWLDMEEAQRQGKIRSLGVSNYMPRHIEELISYSNVRPSVLQIEYHPHLIQNEVKEVCDKYGIHLQAYSSLGTSSHHNKLLINPTIVEIARQLKKSPAQILLRWAIQQGVGIIPKSVNPVHIKENMDIFSFSIPSDQMLKIANLDNQTHYCWNPASII